MKFVKVCFNSSTAPLKDTVICHVVLSGGWLHLAVREEFNVEISSCSIDSKTLKWLEIGVGCWDDDVMVFLCLWCEHDLYEDVCFSGEDFVDDKSVEGVLCSDEGFVWEFVWEIGLEAVEVW